MVGGRTISKIQYIKYHSKRLDMIYITNMPITISVNCLIDSLGFSSSKSSGSTVTKEM